MIPNNSRERKRSKVYVPVEKNNHVILEIDNPRKEIDFQTHFVIKKKVELPVTAPKTVIESENIFVGRDAHKKVPVSVSHQKPQIVLPSTHTYRPSKRDSDKFREISVQYSESDFNVYNRLSENNSEQELPPGKSKVKLLIDKFNKAASGCNSDIMTMSQFSGSVWGRGRGLLFTTESFSVNNANVIEDSGDGRERGMRRPKSKKITNLSDDKTGILGLASSEIAALRHDATPQSRPFTAPNLAIPQPIQEHPQVQEAPNENTLPKIKKTETTGTKLAYPFNFRNNNKKTLLSIDTDKSRAFGPRPMSVLASANQRSAEGVVKFPESKDADDKGKKCPTSPMDKIFPVIKMYLKPPRNLSKNEMIKKIRTPENAILELCEQNFPIPINLIFGSLKGIHKVGEGVFGEVFIGNFGHNDSIRVFKVVPIEGSQRVNGEKQKTFSEIYPEIAISKQLSLLHEGYQMCSTDGYARLHNARIAKGGYPEALVETWKSWDTQFKSDNDCPEFNQSQLYVIFEFDYGGKDAEAFLFTNARQAFYLAIQIAHILAVGECSMEFEHRDLHWGNILVQKTDAATVSYVLNGREVTTPSCNIKGCIIDFTIARMVSKDKIPVFLDLQDDEEQFLGTGEFQFDIYRMMRDLNRNNWEPFFPKTNTYWVHYLADKLLEKGRYLDAASPEHLFFLKQLRVLKDNMMRYNSCNEFVFDKLCQDFKKLEPPNEAVTKHKTKKVKQEKVNKFNVVY